MKNVIFFVAFFCVVVVNLKYGLDLTELFSYLWQFVNWHLC